MTSDGQPYYRVKYKQIIQEQVMLGYLTKGGVTFSESDEMTPYERKIALDTIRDHLEEQSKINEKMINDAKSQKSDKSHPKSGLNH